MSKNGQPRIGVFICHCGTNIAGKVNVVEVVEFASKLDNVAVAKDYKFMCSDPGQELIKQSIKENNLNRVVVASCSPLMHEPTFRGVTAEGGLNPFYFQMSNIREHCSWVTEDPEKATKKAKALISAAVRRVALHDPLAKKAVPVRPEILIVGGGIAGIQAALTYANSGKKVYLVEKQPSIGGHMSMLDKTFPTLDCSACILTPRMTEVGKHPNIELLSWSEVKEVSGFVGNFKVKIRKKARYVDIDKCNGCGACWENCPTIITPSERVIRKGDVVIKRLERE
jgi:heterodisulfide reductase subunit A